MSYRTCDHLKEDGVFCDSPALHGQTFCYFHLNVRARRLQAARARRRGESCRIQLPVLENMHAVQASLMQVLDALADDRMDHKRAGLMLYALQQAATNLNSTPGWKGERQQVEPGQPNRALEAPDVAEQYDLPRGVDLTLPPEAALAAAEQPAGASQQVKPPKERRRLERMPERAVSEADKYYHFPKEPGSEISIEEMGYLFSRGVGFTDDHRKPDAEARAAGMSFDADGMVEYADGRPSPNAFPDEDLSEEEEVDVA